jgi:lysophospholipase L1-like esterase
MFGWNDEWAAASGIPDHRQEFPPAPIIWLQNQFGRLHLYRLLKKLWLGAIEPSSERLFDPDAVVRRVDLENFRANLQAMVDSTRGIGAVPILVTEPQPSHQDYGPAVSHHPAVRYHQRYNDVVRVLSAQQAVALVDAAAAFDREPAYYDTPREDFIHFNAAGHDLIARIVAATISAHD